MAWLPRECGGFAASGAWRLFCRICSANVVLGRTMRRGDTHADEPCDSCGKILNETASAEKEWVQ